MNDTQVNYACADKILDPIRTHLYMNAVSWKIFLQVYASVNDRATIDHDILLLVKDHLENELNQPK